MAQPVSMPFFQKLRQQSMSRQPKRHEDDLEVEDIQPLGEEVEESKANPTELDVQK